MSDLDSLIKKIRQLRPDQLRRVEAAVEWLVEPIEFSRDRTSDFASEEFCLYFGDILRMHHLTSQENFTKDKFEHAVVAVIRQLGRDAHHAPRGFAGRDLVVDGKGWSLKTQGDRSIRKDELWISKFKELGRGDWTNERDLAGLRDGMLRHMDSYERIFTLRCLSANKSWPSATLAYELVEIPKALLREAANGTITMQHESRQTPKPGYCRVTDGQGRPKFELYFDGGTERKLQIKGLRKELCTVHASWTFTVPQ